MKEHSVLITFIATIVVTLGILFLITRVMKPKYYDTSRTAEPESKQSSSSLTDKFDKNQPVLNLLPEMNIDMTKNYTAVITTTAGTMTIKLTASQTPVTVNNFITLAKKGFYADTIFHRVIKGFMIQGGDPTGTGAGGPGYKFDDEPFTGEYTRGTIAMANAGPNTNGSQFFIMHQDYPLPKNYVIFGKLIDGFDTLDKIAEARVSMSPSEEDSQPLVPVKIITVEITKTD